MNEASSVPACVGIIMDGNRRWAKEHRLFVFEGHRAGYGRLRDVVKWARDAHISHVVAYAFSTENWKRSEEEVGYLMKLFRFVLETETQEMVNERIRVRFVGDRSRFGGDMRTMMEQMEAATAEHYDLTLHLAMSYGGRAEIVAAADAAAKNGEITEESLAKNLWTVEMPDPDLIIRTGGEKRLSGFLSWQSVYSELFFIDSFWPAFTKEEFGEILAKYSTRKRNFGV